MNGAFPLYTIGYQGASLADFIAALRQARVRTLVDVRYQPFSRRPEFRQRALAAALAGADIGYRHMRQLGNPPESRDAARAGDMARYKRLFQAHLDLDASRAALDEAADLGRRGPAALMCLERAPEDCHRLMVAERIGAIAGLRLEHLHPAGPPPPRQPRLL